MGVDYIATALMPWQWITGGNFSLVLVSVLVVASYIKYQKVLYPILIGSLFLPIAYFVFPTQFLWFAIIMAGVAIAELIYYAYISQTNEP